MRSIFRRNQPQTDVPDDPAIIDAEFRIVESGAPFEPDPAPAETSSGPSWQAQTGWETRFGQEHLDQPRATFARLTKQQNVYRVRVRVVEPEETR